MLLFHPAAVSAGNFAVTSPWIGFIASFIAGDTKNVRYLSNWDSSGNVIKTSSPRSGEIIIAIDLKDAENFRIKPNLVLVSIMNFRLNRISVIRDINL